MAKIDAIFQNSLAEPLTETETAFQMSFVEMTSAILVASRLFNRLSYLLKQLKRF